MNNIILSAFSDFDPSSIIGAFLLIILLIVIISILASAVKIVPQSTSYVVQRLGAYHQTLGVGVHFIVPFIDKVVKRVSLKEQILDFPPQPVITKDNVTMQIDTVIYYQVTDSKLYTYGVANPIMAMEMITATSIRNIIGELELDETLTSRDLINSRMRLTIDEATDDWGIKVRRVEVRNIIPPRDIQEAMEKQMRAERERRESILRAEGEKRSAILIAEGEKESTILRSEAKKQAMIAEAEGEAIAIKAIYDAQAAGIKSINEAKPDQSYLTLKGFEALEKIASTDSTKIIIPSELQGLAASVASLGTILESSKGKK